MATTKQLSNGVNNNAKDKRVFKRVLKKVQFCSFELSWYLEQFEKATGSTLEYDTLRMNLASIEVAMDVLKISLASDFESLLYSLPVDEAIDG